MLSRSFGVLSFLSAFGALMAGGASVGCGDVRPEEASESASQAASAYEECAQILRGDIMNKVVRGESGASAARDVLLRSILTESVSVAYSVYSKLYDEAAREASNGGAQINSVFFSAGHSTAEERGRKLSLSQFESTYNSLRTHNAEKLSRESSQSSSFVSNYASYVRDQATVRAWEACVTRDAQPGLYAYGSRDEAGNPYVNVVWTPGPFAGVAPSIDISFVKPAGLSVTGEASATVAVGTGRSFGVTYATAESGFDVSVNGSLYDGAGRLLGSFNSSAHVPSKDAASIEVPAPACVMGALRCDANVGERCNYLGGWDPSPDACILTCTERGGTVCGGQCVTLGSHDHCSACFDRCTGAARCRKFSDRTGRYRRMCVDDVSL